MVNIKKMLFFMAVIWFASATLQAGGKKYTAPVDAEVLKIPAKISSPWYIGGGVVWNDFFKKPCSPTEPTCQYEDKTYGVMIRGGYEVDPYFGLEGRAARTFLDKGPFGGVPVEHVGLFLKPQYPLTKRFNLYGLFGLGYTKSLANGARLQYFDDDTGFSAGMGIEYDFSDVKGDFEEGVTYDRAFDGYADQGIDWTIFLDYQRLLIKSGAPDIDMISLGLRYDF